MNGSNVADVELLKDRYDELTDHAEELESGGDHEDAADVLERAAGVLDTIAEKESNQYRAKQREQRAKSHRHHAAELRGDPPDLDSDGTADDEPETAAETTGTPEPSHSDKESTDSAEKDPSEWSYFDQPPEITLSDIGGLKEEVGQIQDGIIKPHAHPEVYEAIGVTTSNGVLLHGPPGTGKSLIARGVANELDEPYARVSAADLGSEYVNVGAQNIQELFAEARECAPCVVFIDELDALARSRSSGADQTDGSRQMVNQLLMELEELEGSQVCVIGATNLVDDIDSAIRRSGRFDRKIQIGAPDDDDRREIFQIHLEDCRLQRPIDLAELVARTSGFSGADIRAVVDQAGERRGGSCIDAGVTDPDEISGISQQDLIAAIKNVQPSIEQWQAEQRQQPFE